MQKKIREILNEFKEVSMRELRTMFSRPLYLFCMIIAPISSFILLSTLMGEGLPTNMPIGICDEDNSSTTRSIIRNLNAFQQSEVVARYANINEATQAMRQGEIYAFYYIPNGTTANLLSSRQPKVSFYLNYNYLIAGSLTYRDMRMMSELANGSVGRATLRAKGATDDQAMSYLQPITITTNPLGNPWLNYAVYLCNTIFPGILSLLIFLTTVWSISSEIKFGTSKEWIGKAGGKIGTALIGKLAPQTLIFSLIAIFYNTYLYLFLKYPCNDGIAPMILASLLLVIASQGFGIFVTGLLPSPRWALSIASLWGVLSFSISGFSFPVEGMSSSLQAICNLFPLRHYFLIYVNQALLGYPITFSAYHYATLLIFCLLPFIVLHRLKRALLTYPYIP